MRISCDRYKLHENWEVRLALWVFAYSTRIIDFDTFTFEVGLRLASRCHSDDAKIVFFLSILLPTIYKSTSSRRSSNLLPSVYLQIDFLSKELHWILNRHHSIDYKLVFFLSILKSYSFCRSSNLIPTVDLYLEFLPSIHKSTFIRNNSVDSESPSISLRWFSYCLPSVDCQIISLLLILCWFLNPLPSVIP